MQRTLLSLAAVGVAAAALSAQCVQPSQFITTFDGGTFFGSPTVDPGCCHYFDLEVKAGLTINAIGTNFLNNGLTFSGFTVPNLVGTTARYELYIVDITGGLNGGTVVAAANLPRTYLHNPTTMPTAPWNSIAPDAAGTFLVAAPDNPSMTTSFTALHLNPGTYGVCMVFVPNGTTFGTPGTTAPASSTLHPLFTNRGLNSQVIDQIFTLTSRGERTIAFGAAANAQFQPNLRIDYTLDANSAYSTSYGNGCYDRKKTFYQAYDGPANPLGAAPNVTTAYPHLQLLPLGSPVNQYFVSPAGGTYPLMGVPGSTNYYDVSSAGATPTHVNNGNPAVSLFGGWDDSASVLYTLPFTLNHPSGAITQISICSNGIVHLGPNAALAYVAGGGGGGRLQFFHLYTEFCDGAPAFSPAFGDLWPADNVTFSGGTGEIYADSDGASWVAISWVNCQEYPNTVNGTFGNSFQVVINSSGIVDYAWGNFKNSDAAPCIIGYSAGDGLDPGVGMAAPRATVPQSAGGLGAYITGVPFLSGNGDKPPILKSVNRPKIGQPLLMQSSNLDPSIMAVITFISGTSIPGGFDLGGVLNMPGCNAYILLPQIVDGTDLNLGAPTSTANFGVIPNLPGNYFAQSAGLSIASPPFNGQNILVSNAVCLHVAIN
jgi:hypothetical protein